MKGVIYHEDIVTAIFPHVKISSFRAKAHLVFHWCLYNKQQLFTEVEVASGVAIYRGREAAS